ncbi:hypothetical protein BDF20DRAFT_831051 [Mycotypha africana]|uniref:uncharacterized protein n=1 Tax=Mycotypha africana TaxID=64632 RepID=UPI0022FFCC26|nr:uncharacterized protein BDF20DRAFT_831051 [Mycotypha africana]KAI8990963.1 hypothetical protein BDF20DRAFT_831051 [Mycotypha africana]
MPLVIFDNGMYGNDTVKMRGHITGVTGRLYKELLRRQRTFLTAVADIAEFRTSKSDDMEDVKIQDGSRLFSTKVRKAYQVLWQRDVNASKNITTIVKAIWTGQERPGPYKRDRYRRRCCQLFGTDSLKIFTCLGELILYEYYYILFTVLLMDAWDPYHTQTR